MSDETLIQIFWERVKTTPERPAILHKVEGSYKPVIWREHGRVVELVAGGLLSRGVKPGDKVAILSNSNPHWTWADIGIMSAGGITVPIYPTLHSREIEFLLSHSDSTGVILENERQLHKVLSIEKFPAALRFAVLLEGEPHRVPEISRAPDRLKIAKWRDLLEDGEVYLPGNPDVLDKRIQAIKPEGLATIVYTSGTTGVPKGAMLTHKNLYSVCQSVSNLVGFHADDIALSFLPLAHVYERVGGQFLSIYEGLVMAYAESMEAVAKNMLEVRPTIMNAVPRFFEKVYNRMHSEIRKMPKAQQYLIRWALALGTRAQRMADKLEGQSLGLMQKIYKAELRVADRLVYSKIRNRFGGRVRFMVSGAAPLSIRVQSFFETIGIPIVEGYGLTETSAPVCCNTPGFMKRGTVGRPLPGVEMKLADDGEILVKGDSIFSGYYKNDDATAGAFTEEGWFKTGDIGSFDEDGLLSIKDRKKDIIITAGGKHVAPQFLENLFVGEGLISRILVYGDRRKFISALITLNPDALEAFARANTINYSTLEELYHHPVVVKAVESMVSAKNQRLARFEQIKKFLILDREFSVEENELTPTLKLKRKAVTEKYRKLLDSLYEAEDLEAEEQVEK